MYSSSFLAAWESSTPVARLKPCTTKTRSPVHADPKGAAWAGTEPIEEYLRERGYISHPIDTLSLYIYKSMLFCTCSEWSQRKRSGSSRHLSVLSLLHRWFGLLLEQRIHTVPRTRRIPVLTKGCSALAQQKYQMTFKKPVLSDGAARQ